MSPQRCLGCRRAYQRLGTNPDYKHLCGPCARRAEINKQQEKQQ